MRSPRAPHDPPEAGDALATAFRWLQRVDGRLLCKPDAPDGPDGWVAIVRTPAAPGHRGEVILGFGDSPLAALETVQERWDRAWHAHGPAH